MALTSRSRENKQTNKTVTKCSSIRGRGSRIERGYFMIKQTILRFAMYVCYALQCTCVTFCNVRALRFAMYVCYVSQCTYVTFCNVHVCEGLRTHQWTYKSRFNTEMKPDKYSSARQASNHWNNRYSTVWTPMGSTKDRTWSAYQLNRMCLGRGLH